MQQVTLEYERTQNLGILRPSANLHGAVWSRLRIAALQYDSDARTDSDRIELDWSAAVLAVRTISKMRADYGFEIVALGEAHDVVVRNQQERTRLRDLGAHSFTGELDVKAELSSRGWDHAKRELKEHQVNDLRRLVALDHGANFSVPGAGKTTVAFAVHLLTKRESTQLLVVSPKIALGVWARIVSDIMSDNAGDAARPFIRLDGTDDDIRLRLSSRGPYFMVTYDRLVRSPMLFRDWLARTDVHLMLDESHRIKAGALSLRGRILGSLKNLPVRRDILSGTPVPNTPDDLATQFEFLYPTERYGQRIRNGEPARNVIANLYVRTTKADLDIPPMDEPRFEDVPMSVAQAAFYSWLRARTLPLLRRALVEKNIARPVHGSVMRLLQASSNARWAVMRTFDDLLSLGEIPEDLMHRVMAEGDSNKLLYAASAARDLAGEGRRVVIWTGFRDNIVRLTELLDSVGVTFIDGSVASGSEADTDTREGRIADFHRDGGPSVLIANPAACSEGISLHQACHDAIYLDRSYNGAFYLQSLDRIHRLGLAPGTRTKVTILQSSCDGRETVDHSVSRRLKTKLIAMEQILNDQDVRRLAIAEEEGDGTDLVRDIDLNEQDVQDLIEQIEKSRYSVRNDDE